MAEQIRERYHFIHNVLAHFYKDMMDWFSVSIYPRFEYRVMGTYDKACEYLQKQCQFDRETDKPLFPALVLNPTGEFGPADATAGGKQLWRYPNLAPTLVKRLIDPVYQDQHTLVNVAFLRLKGEFELIMLLNSFYEYCDLRLLFINYFGGMDRIIYPVFFSSFIILPEEFLNYRYTDPDTGFSYVIDWESAGATSQLVKSTSRTEMVIPVNIKPQISLVSLSDASSRYGGADRLADWRLNASINYEIEIPTYLILETDYLAENIDFEIRSGSVFSAYNDYQPPEDRILTNYSWSWGLDSTSHTQILDKENVEGVINPVADFHFKTRYFHIVSQSDIDSTGDFVITIPEQISWYKVLIVNSKYGELKYGDHYIVEPDGVTLVIKRDYVNLELDMVLELYIYERVE